MAMISDFPGTEYTQYTVSNIRSPTSRGGEVGLKSHKNTFWSPDVELLEITNTHMNLGLMIIPENSFELSDER